MITSLQTPTLDAHTTIDEPFTHLKHTYSQLFSGQYILGVSDDNVVSLVDTYRNHSVFVEPNFFVIVAHNLQPQLYVTVLHA